MKKIEDIKKVSESIILSYQSRIASVAAIVDNTHQILDRFKTKRNEINNKLKETLAKEGSLRKTDFNNMIGEVLSHQDEKETRVKKILKTFFEEQKEIAEVIKENLFDNRETKVESFRQTLRDIQVRQKARENEVSVTLKEFQEEYKEMAEALQNLLDKRETIRIKDFKGMIQDIHSRQWQREEAIREKLKRPEEKECRDMDSEQCGKEEKIKRRV